MISWKENRAMRTVASLALVVYMTNLNAVVQFENEFGTLVLGTYKMGYYFGGCPLVLLTAFFTIRSRRILA
jgi:hypothetical protein